MKKITKYFNRKVALLFLMTGLVSCNDYLEVAPKEQIADAALWASTGNADLFLNNIYASIPGPFNTDDLEDNYTDDAMNGIPGRVSGTLYANSTYTPSNAPSYWGQYTNIRKCNLFIEKVTASAFAEEWKTLRIAEARFLRAYLYQLLWTHYGGVPLITDVLNRGTQGDEIFRARSTDQETYQFIVDECAAIAEDLPVKAAEAGRITKGAALTLKGWCELFAAGALKNPSNDLSKWALAAATNKQVIDLNAYSLFSNYETMFYEENNNNVEVIFDRHYLGGTAIGGSREGLQGPWIVGGNQKAWGGVDPTQDIVDEYLMANGLPITDPASGYDPQQPYVNREKRFYQSIVYDGSYWLGFEMVMKRIAGNRNATDLANFNEATNTGYYLRKGLNPKYAINGNQRFNSASFIIFRYAEVLLSYAEAQNEAVGPDDSVYDAINEVRDRSDLTPLPLGLTQDQMRVAIHRERRVELAFEQKRWYDLIRWKLAEVNLNRPVRAMLIEQESGIWVYKVINAPGGNRTFYPEKNYVFPIPQSAINQNEKLTQNDNY
jgi:starch-binding outer membrane protein, SusD/RagB family